MKLNWGIVGTGWIGSEMGDALNRVHGCIYGVCSGSYKNAKLFKKKYGVDVAYKSYEDMLADENVHIVYIATPHNMHYEMIKLGLEYNKHIFCEKAITVNCDQLEEVVEIARKKGLVISDGVTLFHMPLFKKLKEIVQSGKIGKVKMVQANFGSCKEYDEMNRFFSKQLAGGALLDIGVYATSFVQWFMDSLPHIVLTNAILTDTGVDETSGIVLRNREDQMGVISLTFRAKQPKKGIVAGELGYIEVDDFPRASCAKIVYTQSGVVEEIVCGNSALALDYEIEDMERYILEQDGHENLDNIRGVMKTLTTVRKIWGNEYPFE